MGDDMCTTNINLENGLSNTDSNSSSWCEGCRHLKEELARVHKEYDLNYTALKEKIIPTHELIKRYNTKCEKHEVICKKLDDTTQQLAASSKATETATSRLRTAVEEVEPLKKEKEALLKASLQQEAKIRSLQDEVGVVVVLQEQLNALKKETTQQNSELQSQQDALKLKLKIADTSQRKSEQKIKQLKNKLAEVQKRNGTLNQLNQKLQKQVEKYKELLQSGLPRNSSEGLQAKYESSTSAQNETAKKGSPSRECCDPELASIFSDMGLLPGRALSPCARILGPAVSPLPGSPSVSLNSDDSRDDTEFMSEAADLLEAELLTDADVGGSSGALRSELVFGDMLQLTASDDSDADVTLVEMPFQQLDAESSSNVSETQFSGTAAAEEVQSLSTVFDNVTLLTETSQDDDDDDVVVSRLARESDAADACEMTKSKPLIDVNDNAIVVSCENPDGMNMCSDLARVSLPESQKAETDIQSKDVDVKSNSLNTRITMSSSGESNRVNKPNRGVQYSNSDMTQCNSQSSSASVEETRESKDADMMMTTEDTSKEQDVKNGEPVNSSENLDRKSLPVDAIVYKNNIAETEQNNSSHASPSQTSSNEKKSAHIMRQTSGCFTVTETEIVRRTCSDNTAAVNATLTKVDETDSSALCNNTHLPITASDVAADSVKIDVDHVTSKKVTSSNPTLAVPEDQTVATESSPLVLDPCETMHTDEAGTLMSEDAGCNSQDTQPCEDSGSTRVEKMNPEHVISSPHPTGTATDSISDNVESKREVTTLTSGSASVVNFSIGITPQFGRASTRRRSASDAHHASAKLEKKTHLAIDNVTVDIAADGEKAAKSTAEVSNSEGYIGGTAAESAVGGIDGDGENAMKRKHLKRAALESGKVSKRKSNSSLNESVVSKDEASAVCDSSMATGESQSDTPSLLARRCKKNKRRTAQANKTPATGQLPLLCSLSDLPAILLDTHLPPPLSPLPPSPDHSRVFFPSPAVALDDEAPKFACIKQPPPVSPLAPTPVKQRKMVTRQRAVEMLADCADVDEVDVIKPIRRIARQPAKRQIITSTETHNKKKEPQTSEATLKQSIQEQLASLDRCTEPATVAEHIGAMLPATLAVNCVVECTTHMLLACRVPSCTLAECSTPSSDEHVFLTSQEQLLLETVLLLQNKTNMNQLCENLLTALQTKLAHLQITTMPGRCAICRMFTAVCRARGELGRVRVMAYNAALFKWHGFPALLQAIASVWPEALTAPQGGASCVIQTLQHVIMKNTRAKPRKLIRYFARFCGWQETPPDDSTILAKQMLQRLQQITQSQNDDKRVSDEVFDILKALELLAASNGWQWANNCLIIELIWPTLQQWVGKGQPEAERPLIVNTIALLGRVAYHCPKIHADAVKEIIQTMETLMGDCGQPGVNTIEQVAFETILLLSSYQPLAAATACLRWTTKHQANIAPTLRQKILDFITDYDSAISNIVKQNL